MTLICSGTSNVDVEKTDPDYISEKQLVGFTRREGPSSLPSRKRTSSASSSEDSSQRFSNSSPVSRKYLWATFLMIICVRRIVVNMR